MDKVKDNASKAFSAGLGKVRILERTQLVPMLKVWRFLFDRAVGELRVSFIDGWSDVLATGCSADNSFFVPFPTGLLAIGAVAAYTYYENKENGSAFSAEEQNKWNSQRETKKEESK
jgi:hypothetical protein